MERINIKNERGDKERREDKKNQTSYNSQNPNDTSDALNSKVKY